MRHLVKVLQQMIPTVPREEGALLALLERHIEQNKYRAPEVCDWHSAANGLYALMQGREEEPWFDAVLAVWRDEAALPPVPCSPSSLRRRNANARSKRKKAARKATERAQWDNCCCKLPPEDWSCDCLFGCSSCDVIYRCATCGKGYKSIPEND